MTAPSAPQVVLVFRFQHGGSVEEYRCDLPLTIGRSAQASTIVVQDNGISRQHARLELVDHHLVVTDLNSANGTFVNGRRVRRAALKVGDLITVGSYEIAWAYADSTGTTTSVLTLPPGHADQPLPRSVAPIPARQVVEAAESYNREHGHELDGFLSTEHGFLPVEPPLLHLPDSHRAWDDMVDTLPDLFRRLGLRRAFDRLPVLEATSEALPDRHLLRASTMLGIFAHSYQYVETDPPAALPSCILEPWKSVSQRLGKSVPHVSYIDMFFYNWKLRDPAGPRRLDNMDLLVPAWGNAAERIFYLVTTEFAMQLTPVLNAMVQAQEAVVGEDRAGLQAALLIILDQLQHVTQVIYPQIDPNSASRNHLDQVLWAKTVGIAGVPIFDGAPSPAGTAQPHIHALDAFFERRSFDTAVGQQSVLLRGQFPRHWAELVAALGKVSVRQYVERSGNAELRGLYNAVLDAYVGDKGWMGLHRIKAYGFLEVAFKVGRAVTTGAKFTGLFKDKTWEKIDEELSAVREERYRSPNEQVYFGRPRSGTISTDPASGTWTGFIELDVAGRGVHYQPGDRVGVLPENDEELVRRTLRAMQADGDEIVVLTPRWQDSVRLRAGYSPDTAVLPLRTILRFARIRPVVRAVAKRLLTLSGAGSLKRIIDVRMEDQWELWDLLNLLHAAGYDVTQLWKAGPDSAESICAVLPPEDFRLYSIASAMDDSAAGAQTLSLVVGGLDYRTPHTAYSYTRDRAGTASRFLRHVTSDRRFGNKQISLTIVPTPRFRLPADPSRPVVMFAAGSGIAPFHGFIQSRTRLTGTGENRLYFGTRTPEEFLNRAQFEQLEAARALHLQIAFSQADVAARFDPSAGSYDFSDGPRQRLDALMLAPDQAAALWDLLRDEGEGGRHGYFYICGRTGFAAAVMAALRQIIREHTGGSQTRTNEIIREMVAEGRLMQDIFTTYSGHAQQGDSHDISTVIQKNTPDNGYWFVVNGKLYDVTEFAHQHIGGAQIIRHYAGTDATDAYRGVLHHANSEIDALLGLYELGNMRRLQFGAVWAVALGADGLRFVRLEQTFRAWVRYVYLVVGMENALHNDYGFVHATATAGENPAELTPFKAQFMIETHRRFLVSYLDGLIDDDLQRIWEMTVAFCAPECDLRWLRNEIEDLRAKPAYRLVRNAVTGVKQLLLGLDVVADAAARSSTYARVSRLCWVFAAEDKRVLYEMKTALRRGVEAFEQHEADVVALAGEQLMTSLRETVTTVGDYYQRVADQTAAQGISLSMLPDDLDEQPVAADRGLPGHGGPIGPLASHSEGR